MSGPEKTVTDLMAALQASVERAKEEARRKRREAEDDPGSVPDGGAA